MRRSLDISLPSGEVLAASLEVPAAGGALVPGVLLCHGFTGHKSEDGRLFVRLARALAADGIASLRFDFRGSGDSDGDFADLTIESELEDARAALARLAAEPGVDPGRLALVGLSLGSTISALLAGERADLAALVLWATVAHPGELFRPEPARRGTGSPPHVRRRGTGSPPHVRQGEPRPGWAVREEFYASCARAEPLAALARHSGPLLCVHGTRDYVPRAWAEAARATSRHPASALELVEGEHTFGAEAGKARAVELTRSWLRRVLGATPRAAS